MEDSKAQSAANKLVTDNMGLVHQFARKHFRSVERYGIEYEDFVNDLLIALLGKAGKYDPARAKYSTFATWIMKSRLFRYKVDRDTDKRKAADHTGGFAVDDDGAEFQPEGKSLDESAHVDVKELIERASKKLSQRERQVLHGRFWDGKTCAEIGEELGVTRGRIQQIEKAALEKCKSRIENKQCGEQIQLTCFGCQIAFPRRRAQHEHRLRLGITEVYCCQKCFQRHKWKQRSWTERDDEFLRRNQHLPRKTLAQMLGRGHKATAINSRMIRIGLSKASVGKWVWTEDEYQYLREHLATDRIEVIAKNLNRTPGAISLKLYQLGLTNDHKIMFGEREALARELHAAGGFDRDVAKAIGVSESVYWNWRKRNGLKVNGHASISREAVEKRQAGMYKKYGMSYIEFRKRQEAAAMGWPNASSREQAMILTSLLSGPKTIEELAQVLGRSPRPNGYYSMSLLRTMAARGLIKQLAKGNKNQKTVYQILESALPIQKLSA